MSDFTGNFWSVYVAGLTLASIAACLLLLWLTARKKGVQHGDNTTGHVWDEDLREMNNPMPRWWVWLFVMTIVFSLLYLVAYPGLGSYPGEWSDHPRRVCERGREGQPRPGAALRAVHRPQPEELRPTASRWASASGCS